MLNGTQDIVEFEVDELIANGEKVIVFGRFTMLVKATGKGSRSEARRDHSGNFAAGLLESVFLQVRILVGGGKALLARFDRADAKFNRFLTDVRNRGAWDDTFVDALCEPPETFSFGGMFAHIITFNTYRRLTALDALRRLGVNVEGFGCPTEYESSITPLAHGTG